MELLVNPLEPFISQQSLLTVKSRPQLHTLNKVRPNLELLSFFFSTFHKEKRESDSSPEPNLHSAKQEGQPEQLGFGVKAIVGKGYWLKER